MTMVDFSRERDAVIVGGGPAGAAAAFWLASQGLDVLVLEAKNLPRSKPCGDGIGPRAVLALREMGLEGWLNKIGRHRIERIRIVSPSGAALVSGAEPELFPVTYGYVVGRDVFDKKLIDHAAGAGAEVAQNVHADGFLGENGQPTGPPPDRARGISATHDGRPLRIRAKVTVVADGSTGRLSRLCNPRASKAKAVALRAYAEGVAGIDDCINIFFNRRYPYGYGWIFPTGPITANIGVGLLRAAKGVGTRDIRSAFSYFLEEQDLTPLSLVGCRLIGRPAGSIMRMDFRHSLIQRPGLALIGDAAGLVSPLSGEGIGHALESGRLLADSLEGAFGDPRRLDLALASFDRGMRRSFATYFWWAHLLSRILSRPERFDRLVAKANRHRRLRLVLAGAMTDTAHPRELGRLGVLMRMFI